MEDIHAGIAQSYNLSNPQMPDGSASQTTSASTEEEMAEAPIGRGAQMPLAN